MTGSPRRVAGTVPSCRGSSKRSSGRSPPSLPRPARPTPATSGRSSSGPIALALDGPARVDRTTLRRYLAYLSTRRYAPRTIARRASALRRYFAWLVRTGRLTVDPAAGLHAPKGDSRLPRVLRGDELKVLLDEPPAVIDADDDAIRLRDDAVLELLYGSGLRVAELCGLSPADLDCPSSTVTVWGKGSKQRKVPMSEPAVEAVSGWLRTGRQQLITDVTPADAVFLNRRGVRLTPRDVRGSSTGGPPRRRIRTRCGTASPLIFSTVVPI